MLSRIVSAILLVLAGAVFGAIGTIAHQYSVTWGIPIPLGLIGSLLAFTALLVGLRLLGHSRLPARTLTAPGHGPTMPTSPGLPRGLLDPPVRSTFRPSSL